MRRILLSGVLIVGAISALIFGTQAFFSDTETSSNNTFVAGSIDLKVGNASYLIRDGLVSSISASTWSLTDLEDELFFNLEDFKPGDMTEDTISLRVDDNDSYLCMDIELTGAAENVATTPETNDGDDLANGNWDGELDDELSYMFWADDGDNVLEENEADGFLIAGKASEFLQGDDNGGIRFPLADTTLNIWKASTAGPGDDFTGPVTGEEEYFIGQAWCYGELAPLDPVVTQDNLTTEGPMIRNTTGLECEGILVTNVSQTDSMEGNVSFYAEQSRNNPDFVCNPDLTGS